MTIKNSISTLLRGAACLVILLFFSFRAAGQGGVPGQLNTGYPENGVFHGSQMDNVQINNLGLHAEIPIYSMKGRGLNIAFKVIYNSKSWTFHTRCFNEGGGFCEDDVITDPLGYLGLAFFGAFDYAFSSSSQTCQAGFDLFYTHTGGYTLREPNGTKHHFGPDPFDTQQACTPPVYPSIVYADDGSGWIMQINTSNGYIIQAISKSGIRVLAGTVGIAAPAAEIIDANGNELSPHWVCCSGWGGTDTLGRNIPASGGYYDSSGTLRSPAFSQNITVNKQTSLCQFSNADACVEDTSSSILPTQLQLPNGDVFTFNYAQNAGAELTSMTLPTGGTISWTWGDWGEGGRNVATRTVTANGVTGTWVYGQSSSQFWAVVTDPAQNDTGYTCIVLTQQVAPTCDYVSEVQYFNGRVGSGAAVKTVTTDYNSFSLGPVEAYALPIRETTAWNQQNIVRKSETDWETFAVSGFGTVSRRNPTEEREFDWVTAALLRKTDYFYLHNQNPAYLNANIVDRPTDTKIYDGSNTLFAETQNSYDGSSLNSTGNCSSGGAPQHDYCNYGTGNLVRGNVTQISRFLNTNNTFLNTTHTYDDLGNALSTTDPRQNTTTISYADNWADSFCVSGPNTYAFPTLIKDPLNFRSQTAYYTCTSMVQNKKEENDLRANRPGTSYQYDLLGRRTLIQTQDAGNVLLAQTAYSYNDTPPMTITKTVTATPDPNIVSIVQLDDLGRIGQTHLVDPDGDVYSETTYDAFGRKSTQTNPHRTATGPTDGTTQYAYNDPLGRLTSITRPDGSSTLTSYSSRATEVQDEGNGNTRVTRISQVDGLGRLVSVCEVTNAAQMGGNSPSACNQDISGTGFLTSYQYDPLDNLKGVQQGVISRSFTYDSLSRLLIAQNPESGTTCYGTYSNSACQLNGYDNNGNLLFRTRPAPNQGSSSNTITTTYQYDADNRLLQQSYSDNVTPTVTRNYDTTSELGVTLVNTAGRLSAEYVKDASGNLLSGRIYSYDPLGRIKDNSQCTPQNCPSGKAFSVTYSYDLAGQLNSTTNGLGTTFSSSYNAAGSLTSLTSSLSDSNHPANLYSGLHYSPLGAVTTASLGNGLNEAFKWDCRGRVLGYASVAAPGTPSQSLPNTSGCPDTTALNIGPNRLNVHEQFFRFASLGIPSRREHSILLSRLSGKHNDDGSIRIILTPLDPEAIPETIVIRYRKAETTLAIAQHLAGEINQYSSYGISAAIHQLGSAVRVDLSTNHPFLWPGLSLSVSISSKHKNPSVTATVLPIPRSAVLLGLLASRQMEAK